MLHAILRQQEVAIVEESCLGVGPMCSNCSDCNSSIEWSALMAAAGKAMKAKSVQGAEISVDATKDVMVDKAKVVKADIEASNGVVHVIDAVILPPAK